MYVYKVVVGVELINELLRKSGWTACLREVFKPFKELDLNNYFFKKILNYCLQLNKNYFFSVHSSEFSHKISNVFRFPYFK